MEELDSWTWTWKSLPSKKNSKRIIQVFRDGKPTPSIISSQAYLDWENGFVREIKSLWTVVGKCSLATVTISAPNLRSWDVHNKWESVADALVKAGYLFDDDVSNVPKLILEYGWLTWDGTWRIDAAFFRS